MNNYDDDLFDDEKVPLSPYSRQHYPSHSRVASSSRTFSSGGGDDEDEFYEKLGGSLYGESNASTVKQPGVRFTESVVGRNSLVGSTHQLKSSVASPLMAPRESYRMMQYPSFEYNGPEYPQSTYNRYSLMNVDEMASMPNRMSVGYQQMGVPIQPDDYNLNLLEEAADDMDPFGDDDSLFSEADPDELRRGMTLRRTPTQARPNTEDEDSLPVLTTRKQ